MGSQKSEFGRDNRKRPDDQAERLQRDRAIEQRLDVMHEDLHCIIEMLKALTRMENEMADNMDTVLAALNDNDDEVEAIGMAIDKLVQLVKDAGNDPAKVAAALAKISQHREALVAAILRGTPSDPGGSTGGVTG